MECLQELERDRREQANINSYTHAVGWSGLFNGFGGKDSEKTSPVDLLPFKDEVGKPEQKISDRTRSIILESLKEKAVSPQIASALLLLL